MRSTIRLALLLAVAAPAAAQTAQQRYDAAQAAFDRGDWPAAIVGFEPLVRTGTDGPPSYAQAVIRARLAEAYLHTNETAKARRFAASALPGLASQPAEAATTALTLGDAARYEFDMAAATEAYGRALALADGPDAGGLRNLARSGTALALMTSDPSAAAAAIDAMLADEAATKAWSRDRRAQVEGLRGRVELNRGDARAAVRWLNKAIDDSGGLGGAKVNLAQVAIRGDAAIAYQLLHEDELTRKYLTWTGAGHLKSQDWTSGASMPLPVCEGDGDFHAADTAVIEFAIGTDGRVVGAAPIYANRPGRVGTDFARAVHGWHWNPASLDKLSPFWRSNLRVQLRCLTRPAPESLSKRFVVETAGWLHDLGVPAAEVETLLSNPPVPAADPRLLRDDAVGAAAMFGRIMHNRTTSSEAARLGTLLDKLHAPAAARAVWLNETTGGRKLGEALPAFEQAWPGSRAAWWLRLRYGLELGEARNRDGARAQFALVAAAPAAQLPAGDPIRTVATVELATLENHAGATSTAQARIADAGLSPEQCALVPVQPLPVNSQVAQTYFPSEAQRWGFEGFVRVAYDIAADGQVRDARTVLAYPPFVFDAATERAAERFRFVPPTVGSLPVGCNQNVTNVRYQMQAR